MTQRLHVEWSRSVLEEEANSHNRLWPDLQPAATAEAGEELILDVRDGMDGQLTAASGSEALLAVDLQTNHPLTGPVEIRGAQPGDVAVIEILAIEPRGVGATAVIPGFGLLGDLFERPFLAHWEVADGVARSAQLPGVAIPGRPFLGCVAVAPSAELVQRASSREAALAACGGFALPPSSAGAVPTCEPYASRALRTIPPRENGGNLDVPQLGEGSKLLLQVQVPGAMVSIGDPHFAQGEGECCGTAIEIAARVRVRVALRAPGADGWAPRFPALEFSEQRSPIIARSHFMTTGIPVGQDGQNADLDLTLAARQALLEMLRWLECERGLSREQAYVLASVAADLRIAEAVNRPNGLVTCRLPLDVFEER